MKNRRWWPLLFLLPLLARAEPPREYQVTGAVAALTDEVIILDRAGEKWEIGRSPATRVEGRLAVGRRVTVFYRMGATAIEVRSTEKADQAAEKAAEKAAALADKAEKARK